MIHIDKILCPSDFSDRSAAAFQVACALARDHGASLIILHVRENPTPPLTEFGAIPPTELPSRGEVLARLSEFEPRDGTIHYEQIVSDGRAAEEIVRTAEQHGCDMIVMGTHGRSGFSRFLMGSVAEEVVRNAPCPVLTLKAPVRFAEASQAEQAVAWTGV